MISKLMSAAMLKWIVSQCRKTPKLTITHGGHCVQTLNTNTYYPVLSNQKASKIIHL